MKNFSCLLAGVFMAFAIILLFTGYSSSQDRNPLDTRVIMPLVMPEVNYGIDAIISVGPFDNYMVSATNGFCETDIGVNTRNPLNFCGTDNRMITSARYIYYTNNGGVSWSNTPATMIALNQGDPAFCSDSLGNFYFMVLNSGLVVWKSSDGGATWTGPTTVVSNGNADKEWIAADRTGGTYQNNVYAAYVNFGAGVRVDFWRSTNNGVSWTGPTALANSSTNPGPDVETGPNGRVYVAWENGGGASIKYSTDGGASFSSEILAASYSEPGNIGPAGRHVVKDNIRVNGMPHMAVDMSSGPRRGWVYICYPTNPPGPDIADVYLVHSTDGGNTWSSPVRVNDDPFGVSFVDQWMPDVSVDDQGRVWMMWWDSRNDQASNILSETWGACSTDGGNTILPNFRISNQNFNPNAIHIQQPDGAYYLGDYQGIAGKTITFPFYACQNNTYQDFTAYMPDYGMSFAKAVDSVNPNGFNTNTLNVPLMGPYAGTVTFTHTISPSPAPGTITINYSPSNVATINGNPVSLGLTIIASATVPQQMYTVSVTGAETGGPRTHTRSFNVLVGNFVGVQPNGNETPQSYNLFQNYPNPFNPSTKITYSVPKQSLVNIKVFDVLGREVAALVNNQPKAPGEYNVTFDASNLPSGVYYYKMTAGDFSYVRKMILMK